MKKKCEDIPQISIIMPVYNSKEYLLDTVQTILDQDFQAYEIILIDDGSTDGSSEICDKLQEKDKRIRVIHQKNGGICAARNAGLNVAQGVYIAFCDNDDHFLAGLLKDNYQLARKYDADLVRFGRQCITIKNGRIISDTINVPQKFAVIDERELSRYFTILRETGDAIWIGLYKRQFLEDNSIRFDETMKYGCEDFHFNMQVYLNNPKIVLNPKVYYCWFLRYEHSTSGKYNLNNVEALIKGISLERQLVEKLKIQRDFPGVWEQEIARYICQICNYFSPLKMKLSLCKKRELLQWCRNEILKDDNYTDKIYNHKGRQSYFLSVVWYLFYNKHYYVLYYLTLAYQYAGIWLYKLKKTCANRNIIKK